MAEFIEILDKSSFSLDELKNYRYSEIDKRTQELIAVGYTFDGQTFSLSLPAQSNLTNIKGNKDTFNTLGLFPITMSTKDNNLYNLAYADVDNMWATAMTVVKTAYNGGGALKKQIFDATTIEEVNNVIDNR